MVKINIFGAEKYYVFEKNDEKCDIYTFFFSVIMLQYA